MKTLKICHQTWSHRKEFIPHLLQPSRCPIGQQEMPTLVMVNCNRLQLISLWLRENSFSACQIALLSFFNPVDCDSRSTIRKENIINLIIKIFSQESQADTRISPVCARMWEHRRGNDCLFNALRWSGECFLVWRVTRTALSAEWKRTNVDVN